MANKWKATLPRELPPVGRAKVCFGFKLCQGTRTEFNGEIDAPLAAKILYMIAEAARQNKGSAKTRGDAA